MSARPDALTGELLLPEPPFPDLPPLLSECALCGRDVLGEVVRALPEGLICAGCDGEIDF